MKKNSAAFGALEYIVLLTFIIGAIAAMSPYIVNAFNGYFRRAGEGMDHRRQHDPYRTRDCIWEPRLVVAGGAGAWYSEKCFRHNRQVMTCDYAVADDLDFVMFCRANAGNVALCNGGASAVNVKEKCPTSCCLTLAKNNCLSQCATMPAP